MQVKDVVPAEERRFGYLSVFEDATALAEDANSQWLHAAPIGEYRHPLYGKIKFTADKIQQFADNLKKGVRGIDVAIDYAHKAGEKAAGWVKDAEVRPNGLWLLVEWTEAAANAIRNKEFRYFSPEFVDQYKDPKTGEVHKNVLLGGGLTNRPFLKDLIPVNLSEVFVDEEETAQQEEEIEQEDNSVNEFLIKLRKQLGLPEDATEEQVLAATGSASGGDGSAQMSELIDQNRTLAEQVDKLLASQRLTEVRYQLKEWEAGSSDDAKFALPPALHEKTKELLLNAPKQLSETFSELVNEILKTGLVSLSEKGTQRTTGEESHDDSTDGGETEGAKKFNDLIESILKEDPELEIGDAVEEATRREPKLFEEYRKSTYSFKEDE